MNDETETETQAGQETVQGEFSIQKIYLKDLSFENPASPAVFRSEWKPEINLEINNEASRIEGDLFEVILTLTLTAKLEDKTAYLVETKTAGIFGVKGFANEQMGPMLGSFCPNILFPYARETVSDVVTRGGFPQLLLTPVNFDALYAQHMQKAQAEQGTEQGAEDAVH